MVLRTMKTLLHKLQFVLILICLNFLILSQAVAYEVTNPEAISQVSVTGREIILSIQAKEKEELALYELSPWQEYQKEQPGEPVWKGSGSEKIELSFPRKFRKRDRLYSHWQLVNAGTGAPIGHSQFISDFEKLSGRKTSFLWNKSKKGVQCIVDIQDAADLKVKHAAHNVHITQIVDVSGKSKSYQTVDGVKVPINLGFIRGLDATVKQMTDAGMNVTLILLNPIPTSPDPRNPFIHPKSNLKEAPNHLGAFNMSDEKGVLYYRAALEFLADRYSRPDKKFGLVSGYIIGNELQSHWWWHNMGDISAQELVDEYALALRIAYLAARNINPEIRVFVSMEHHWTASNHPDPLKAIPGKLFLDLLNQKILEQGNFNWSMAHHPYPENLFEARTWNDTHVSYDFNTPKITFKNLEVLIAYLKQPHFLIEGKPRKIILSEQGFHKPDGPDGEEIQAAAYAYAYYRTMQFPEIDAFILHRHVDHAHEGGLHLGIRENAEGTVTSPGKKRLLYQVFQQADSDNWQSAFEFAKRIIGIQDWSEINARPVSRDVKPE